MCTLYGPNRVQSKVSTMKWLHMNQISKLQEVLPTPEMEMAACHSVWLRYKSTITFNSPSYELPRMTFLYDRRFDTLRKVNILLLYIGQYI